MAHGPAHIQSPDIIKRFRAQFVKFTEECQKAIDNTNGDVNKIQAWLDREQMAYWKRELRKREELVERARSEFTRAKAGGGKLKKTSVVDEKKALERAIRNKEEAEEKIREVKRWLMTIEREAGRALGPCKTLSATLGGLGRQALSRLDTMLDRLDEYLRPKPPQASG